MSAMDRPFEIVRRERVHDGFVKLDLYQIRQSLFDGGTSPELTREVVVAHEAVAVICYDPLLDLVVLVEQARLPAALAGLAPVQVEIVAGLVEPGETPEAVARREVREETGLDLIGRPRKITHMVTTPGHSTETVHLFCGRVDAGRAGGVHGLAAEHEDLRVLALPASDLAAWMADGRIANAIALVGGFWLLANREALRHDWAAAA